MSLRIEYTFLSNVRVIEGMNIVELIENTETGPNDRPVRPVLIADCGELVVEAPAAEAKEGETVAEGQTENA